MDPECAIECNIVKPYLKSCSRKYTAKWKFLQRKILQVLRNQYKDIKNFF